MRCRRTCHLVCGALAAAALPAAAEAGSVIYVDATAPDGGDGSNWVIAFNALQDALAIAAPNDQIWVAAGVYTPAGPNGDREASFALVDNVLLFSIRPEPVRAAIDAHRTKKSFATTAAAAGLAGPAHLRLQTNDAQLLLALLGLIRNDVPQAARKQPGQ